MSSFKMQMKSVADYVQFLNDRTPPGTAEDWDNVGLLVGDPAWQTSGAVLSIDLTREAIDLAVEKQFKLIINHHPCIFPKSRGLSRLTPSSLAVEALQKGIAVISSHTNFDQCALEVVDSISKGLGVQVRGRLIEKSDQPFKKLVTFVPDTHLEAVRLALCEAGAGHIGKYDSCTYSVSGGEGTFRAGEGAHPFLGKVGSLEKVKESRLETVFPQGLQSQILKALFKAHPYEEVAYDLINLEQPASDQGVVRGLGYGFWGEFTSPRPFSDVAKDVKSLFDINGFWITNPVPSSVTRVGFVAGKGASFVDAAIAAKCDLFITGEVGYHLALDGSRRGVTVMELGHRESEKFFIQTMKTWLTSLGVGTAEAQTPIQKIWLGGTK